MNIEEKLLTPNKYSRPRTKRGKTTKIAIHYVGNPGSSAIGNRNYFESLKDGKGTYASSHYIVGLNGEIIRCVPENEIAYTTNAANSYSIGIEVCHPKSDGVFSIVTRKALIELCADLCNRYNLTSEDLIRHFDVTGKSCPLCWSSNNGAKYADWLKFKSEVKQAMQGSNNDDKLAVAVSEIIRKGININFNCWKRKDLIKLNNVPSLLNKLGGLEQLIGKGIITEKEKWRMGQYNANDVACLLIKYANAK